LVYDADTAGQDASLRGADILLEQGMNVFIVELPAGEDPDTFVLSEGSEEFMRLIQEAMNVVEFKATLLQRREGSTRNQITIIQSIVESLSRIRDAIRVNLYVKDLADKFGLREEAIYQELKKKRPGARQSAVSGQREGNSQQLSPADRDLINLLANVEESFFEVVTNQINKLDIQNPISKEIIQEIIDARFSGKELSAVIDELSDEKVRLTFAELAFATPRPSKGWEEIRPPEPNYSKRISQILISFELEQIEQELKLTSAKMTEAEKKGHPDDEVDSRHRELRKRKQILLDIKYENLFGQYFEKLKKNSSQEHSDKFDPEPTF